MSVQTAEIRNRLLALEAQYKGCNEPLAYNELLPLFLDLLDGIDAVGTSGTIAQGTPSAAPLAPLPAAEEASSPDSIPTGLRDDLKAFLLDLPLRVASLKDLVHPDLHPTFSEHLQSLLEPSAGLFAGLRSLDGVGMQDAMLEFIQSLETSLTAPSEEEAASDGEEPETSNVVAFPHGEKA